MVRDENDMTTLDDLLDYRVAKTARQKPFHSPSDHECFAHNLLRQEVFSS